MKKNSKHFLASFEINSFKNLHNVKFDDLGQINLILGDNNVGKSSTLEALMFDSNPRNYLSNLRHSYFHKLNMNPTDGNIDYVTEFVDYKKINSKIEVSAFFSGDKNAQSYSVSSKEFTSLTNPQREKLTRYFTSTSSNLYAAVIKHNTREHVFFQNSPDLDLDNDGYIPFISPKIFYSNDLLRYYSKSIIPSKSKKQSLIKDMQYFIAGLEDVEIATQSSSNIPILVTRIKGVDSAIPLNMYGDGSIKFFRILVEIASAANARLMIDEIDSGIHFSRLKLLWKTIINSAIQNNTQLFITTHNDECLTFLKEVLEEPGFKNMQGNCKCYTLRELHNGSIKAYKYSFSEFSFAIEQQIEMRGGKS